MIWHNEKAVRVTHRPTGVSAVVKGCGGAVRMSRLVEVAKRIVRSKIAAPATEPSRRVRSYYAHDPSDTLGATFVDTEPGFHARRIRGEGTKIGTPTPPLAAR